MTRKMPLYITIVDDHFAKCHTDGVINWTNTRHYSIQEIKAEMDSGRVVRLCPHTGDVHGHYKKPNWFERLAKQDK